MSTGSDNARSCENRASNARLPAGNDAAEMTKGTIDFAIIGGGLVGASIGYGLMRAGKRVAILDEGDRAIRASRGNFALVWVQGKGMGMPAYAHWTVASSNLWSTLAAELRDSSGIDVHFSRPGGFQLCLSEAELEARRATFLRFHNQADLPDARTEILNRREVETMLPEIGPDVVGASYNPFDGHANSLKLFRALYTALDRGGATYLPERPVTAISATGGGFELTTPKGVIAAERIVLAAGNANEPLARMIGLNVPMKPERGQIVVTERCAPFLRHPFGTLRQSDEGTIMIGDSKEDFTDPTISRPEISGLMVQRAVRMFPRLASLNVVRSWSAIRVMPKDGFPIYDESPDMPGAFVATCHSGVTLAAAHALKLAPLLAAGGLNDPALTTFSTRRFHVPAAA